MGCMHAGTGMQQPDQEPLTSQLPADPQPQPEAEVAFEAAPSEASAAAAPRCLYY